MPFRNRQVETTPCGHLHNIPEIPIYSKSSRFHNTTEILTLNWMNRVFVVDYRLELIVILCS